MDTLHTLLGAVVAIASLFAVIRGVEVRFALLAGAAALAVIGNQVQAVSQVFLRQMVNPDFVVPICCSLGFASVVKAAGCDQHLVHLLLAPLRKVRFLLIPGAVLLAFLVNIPVGSQTGTAATVGPILLPVLRAAGIDRVAAGASILLGASIGGELVNPGGPEYGTVSNAIESKLKQEKPSRAECVAKTMPSVLAQLVVSTALLWWLSRKRTESETEAPRSDFRPNLLLAAIPLAPLAILFAVAKPFGFWHVPEEWLTTLAERTALPSLPETRLIGAAMLVGALLAAGACLLTGRKREFQDSAKAFFTGAGFAYAEVISLIVVANTFAKAVDGMGLTAGIEKLATLEPWLAAPAALAAIFFFAFACGSGIASTQALFPLFVGPMAAAGVDPLTMGSTSVCASAAGRTASPVAAVSLMCGKLAETEAAALAKRVFWPCLAGAAAAAIAGFGRTYFFGAISG